MKLWLVLVISLISEHTTFDVFGLSWYIWSFFMTNFKFLNKLRTKLISFLNGRFLPQNWSFLPSLQPPKIKKKNANASNSLVFVSLPKGHSQIFQYGQKIYKVWKSLNNIQQTNTCSESTIKNCEKVNFAQSEQ